MTKKRVGFRFEADPDTPEGHLLNYLQQNRFINRKEAVIRALKAYYLPWSYEAEESEAELRAMALSAIEELEFRAFQIRKHFLGDTLAESGDRNLAVTPGMQPVGQSRKRRTNPSPAVQSEEQNPQPDAMEHDRTSQDDSESNGLTHQSQTKAKSTPNSSPEPSPQSASTPTVIQETDVDVSLLDDF